MSAIKKQETDVKAAEPDAISKTTRLPLLPKNHLSKTLPSLPVGLRTSVIRDSLDISPILGDSCYPRIRLDTKELESKEQRAKESTPPLPPPAGTDDENNSQLVLWASRCKPVPPLPDAKKQQIKTPAKKSISSPSNSEVYPKCSAEEPPVSDQALAAFNAALANPPIHTAYTVRHLLKQTQLVDDPDAKFAQIADILEIMDGECQITPDEKQELVTACIKIIKRLAIPTALGRYGCPDAQYFLGECYSAGTHGVIASDSKALSFFLQGSKQCHPGCTFRAAECYEQGRGIKADFAKAMQFYRKAASFGHTEAMIQLGLILLKGLLAQQPSPREGISWLKRALQQSCNVDPSILHELGLALETPGVSLIPDEEFAFQLFARAAELGYAPSQYKLGLAYEQGILGCPVDPQSSIHWYKEAAEQGDPEAQIAMSCWCLTGADDIFPQDSEKAYDWARLAAEKGDTRAMYALGSYIEEGIGVEANINEAKRWYKRAAAQGEFRSRERLQQLKTLRSSRDKKDSSSRCTVM